MSAKRKGLSKKIRFEVFKRDKFQCQYCGEKAPDVVLECDHISPVSKGGLNDVLNLITACQDCNRGKSDREIDDNTVIEKQRQQLADLEERRQQLEAMLQWRDGLKTIDEDLVSRFKDEWSEHTHYSINDEGERHVKKWLKRFSIIEILDAMEISVSQYGVGDDDSFLTKDSVEKCFDMIPRIVSSKRRQKDNPELSDLYYARGILRNRISYCNDWKALELLKAAHDAGASPEGLKYLCREVNNWTQFRSAIEEFIDMQRDQDV